MTDRYAELCELAQCSPDSPYAATRELMGQDPEAPARWLAVRIAKRAGRGKVTVTECAAAMDEFWANVHAHAVTPPATLSIVYETAGYRYTYPAAHVRALSPACYVRGHAYRCEDCSAVRREDPKWWVQNHPQEHAIKCDWCGTRREWTGEAAR